jgi:hypothetical protein
MIESPDKQQQVGKVNRYAFKFFTCWSIALNQDDIQPGNTKHNVGDLWGVADQVRIQRMNIGWIGNRNDRKDAKIKQVGHDAAVVG